MAIRVDASRQDEGTSCKATCHDEKNLLPACLQPYLPISTVEDRLHYHCKPIFAHLCYMEGLYRCNQYVLRIEAEETLRLQGYLRG